MQENTSKLEALRNEITYRKNETFQLLLDHGLTEEEIEYLCQIFINTPPEEKRPDLFPEDDKVKFFGIAALCSYMSIEKGVPFKDSQIKAEPFAGLMLDAMNGALCLMEAGAAPMEEKAVTRLRQIQNQPQRRHTENPAHDDILDKIEEYEDERGSPPRDTGVFLKYLENNFDYEINGGKVYCRDWDKPRSVGTVKNWVREALKNQTQ